MRHPWVARTVPVLTLLLAAAGCGGARDPGYPSAREGRLVVTWRGGAPIIDAPARATFCGGDSLLVLVGLDDEWGAAVVLHGGFPVDSVRTFAVRPWLGEEGTAAAAFRSVQDSVHRAVMALRGSVRLEPGRRATGRFEMGAAPLPGRSEPVHLVGAFRALPTTDTSGGCSAWARRP